MTFRCALFVTVPTSGPRARGSRSPQTTGIGFGPCPPGWEVRTIAFGCFFFLGRSLVMERSAHPVGVGSERPLGGDLLEGAPQLDAPGSRHVAVAEAGGLGAS